MNVHIYELHNGDRLLKDIYNGTGLHILAAGTEINQSNIEKLLLHRIEYVDIIRIDNSDGEETTSLMSPSSGQAEIFIGAMANMQQMFDQASVSGFIQNDLVEEQVDPLLEHIQKEKDMVSLLLKVNSPDDYTYRHSLKVSMIAYHLSIWSGESEEYARFAAKAGLLHDIGKSKINPDLLAKPGSLTPEEHAAIQKHTIYGYEMIRSSLQDEILALVALQHHKRLDGSGYPYQRKKDQIHPLPRIISIADEYSSMTSERTYRAKKDLLAVLKELHKLSFGKLDPRLTYVFIEHMIPNFIGKKARLSDGREGVIVMTNPTSYFRPLIQVEGNFINLDHLPQLEITHIMQE